MGRRPCGARQSRGEDRAHWPRCKLESELFSRANEKIKKRPVRRNQPLQKTAKMLLLLVLLGVALFADFALFLGLDAALVRAFLASRFCFLATGFRPSEANGDDECSCAEQGDE